VKKPNSMEMQLPGFPYLSNIKHDGRGRGQCAGIKVMLLVATEPTPASMLFIIPRTLRVTTPDDAETGFLNVTPAMFVLKSIVTSF
jgi:hypothetical protein